MTEQVTQVFEMINGLKLSEVAKLVKMLEEKYGVSAAMPIVAAGAAVSVSAVAESAAQTEFNVSMKTVGPNKIEVIKAVRTITNLGLKEAKDLVEKGTSVVKEKVTKDEAEKIKAQLEAAGATAVVE